jgi:hypothetical protein
MFRVKDGGRKFLGSVTVLQVVTSEKETVNIIIAVTRTSDLINCMVFAWRY